MGRDEHLSAEQAAAFTLKEVGEWISEGQKSGPISAPGSLKQVGWWAMEPVDKVET